MDLLMLDRRETLKLAAGAPLIAAAGHLLGGTAGSLNRAEAGFNTDSVAALEEITAQFARMEAAHGGALYRAAVVGQLSETARRVRDGIPASLRTASSPPPPTWLHSPAGPATTPAATPPPSGTGPTPSTRPARQAFQAGAPRSSPACHTR